MASKWRNLKVVVTATREVDERMAYFTGSVDARAKIIRSKGAFTAARQESGDWRVAVVWGDQSATGVATSADGAGHTALALATAIFDSRGKS